MSDFEIISTSVMCFFVLKLFSNLPPPVLISSGSDQIKVHYIYMYSFCNKKFFKNIDSYTSKELSKYKIYTRLLMKYGFMSLKQCERKYS